MPDKRDYTTWEEDFLSTRSELRGYNDELVASIDLMGPKKEAEWVLFDRDGKEFFRRAHKEDVVRLAEQLLPEHNK